MGTCLKTWRQDCCASSILLLLHILCYFLPVLSSLAYVSGILAGTSLLTGIFLVHRHEGLEVTEAYKAQAYLSGVRSDYFKFQGVAVAYSIPRVLLLVGFVVFFSQGAVLIWNNTPLICAIVLILFIFGFFLGLEQTTSQTSNILRPLAAKTARLSSIFTKTAKLCRIFSSKTKPAERNHMIV